MTRRVWVTKTAQLIFHPGEANVLVEMTFQARVTAVAICLHWCKVGAGRPVKISFGFACAEDGRFLGLYLREIGRGTVAFYGNDWTGRKSYASQEVRGAGLMPHDVEIYVGRSIL